MKNKLTTLFIIIIVIGLIATIPLAIVRYQWEESSKQVELVMDFDDIYLLANNTDHPDAMEQQFFEDIRGKVHSIAIPESTLERLQRQGEYNGDIWIYSGKELLDPVKKIQFKEDIDPKHTYILFRTKELETKWEPVIRQFLSKEGEITNFDWSGMYGLEIKAPFRSIKGLSLGIDPVLASQLKSEGFSIVPRISNSYIDRDRTLALIRQVGQFEPSQLIFQGEEVTGFPSHLEEVAQLMHQYHIGLGNIEMLKQDQLGGKTLSYHLAHLYEGDPTINDWNIVRVHSLSEKTMAKMVAPTHEQLKGVEKATFPSLQEQVELAITERNIRVIYLHGVIPTTAHVPIEKMDFLNLKGDPEDMLKATALAINDLTERIESEGYTLGKATSFQYENQSWMTVAKWLALIAGIASLSLLAYMFIPSNSIGLGVFVLGIIGIGITKILPLESLYFKAIGLGTAIAFPTLAIKYSLNKIISLQQSKSKAGLSAIIQVYLISSFISLVGAMIVTGIFHHVKYSLYLDQFRGVSILYLMPLLLSLILVMWQMNAPLISWLKADFKNYYLLILGFLGIGLVYYLMRSGNEATVSSIELKLRALLQSGLDIRPRTKEIFFGHPIFALAIYLATRYKQAVYLLIAAAMGQLSIVSTFTHLHTPLMVGFIRTGLGLAIGLVFGLALIVAWKLMSPWLWKLIRKVGLM